MMNKKFKPLIALPPTEGFSYAERMMLKKSEEMSKRIPIIVIPEEAGSIMDEIQKMADDNKVEVAIIGIGDSGKPRIPNILAFNNYTPSCTTKNDHEEIQRGLSFSFNDLVKDAEPTIPFTGRPVSSKESYFENKKPKKERAQNNRRKKKHKKAKNGR